MDILFIRAGITALIISIIFTPFLIRISRKKGFYASKDHRSSHSDAIPNTGGIVLCFAIVIPLIIYSSYPDQEEYSFLLSAFAVLLITGIIDDFNPIPVVFKFLGQFIPAIVIVMSIDEQDLVIPFIDTLVDLPSFFNYFFWIVFIVMSINAFNLIDGIDGLAISLGIVGGLFYFFQFLGFDVINLYVFSITLVGGLTGLLFYNFSRRNKIFIGDTGSLLIGGLLVFFGLKFISLSDNITSGHSFFLVLGTFFIPFADMIRVAITRMYNGESPFKADRQHIHHLILDACEGNHFLATGIIVVAQVLILVLFQFILSANDIMYFLLIIFAIALYIIFVSAGKKYLKRKH
jgi:UDP-N-acetylmuramyl pentapeptide phosphotransferase/UDP-N-acetylglucosamine-1-phosphate transferase